MSFFKSKIQPSQHASAQNNEPLFRPRAKLKDKNKPEPENDNLLKHSNYFGGPDFFQPPPKLKAKQPDAEAAQVKESANEDLQLAESDAKPPDGSSVKTISQDGSNTDEENAPASEQGEEAQKELNSEVAQTDKVVPAASNYWTHGWHTDRFGNEALFIWEVGGKRTYSNANRGYDYIREKASLFPEDGGYDARFEKFKHRPQANEGKNPSLNWWMKRTPGWDNPDHSDNGTADFNDLAEFKDTPGNRKGTGFYYMGYVFDPLIYEKLAEQKRNRENSKYIGNHTNYLGFVNAPDGIILHDTPTPADKAYNIKRYKTNKADFILGRNERVTVLAEANEDNEGWLLIKNSLGEVGWIERTYISKQAQVKPALNFDTYTVKEGDTLEELIKSYYKQYPSTTGNDRRTVAMAIYLYNKNKPGSGVYRNSAKYKSAESWKDTVDPWMQETRANYASIELYAGGEVVLPPIGYIAKMIQLGLVEKRPNFVNIMLESGRMGQGFIAGVGIGFWDAIIETGEDLINMFKDIFTGEIFSQIADMFDMFMEKGLSGIWEMIKEFGIGTWEEIKAAWNNKNPYERGKYFGKIIGAILFEVVLALLTWGIGSVVRNSARVTKILKWFPNMNKKTIVPKDIDKYGDDIRRLNGDKDVDVNRDKKPDTDINKIESPKSAQKFENEIDATKKKELTSDAKKELDSDPNFKDKKDTVEYAKKLAALTTAKIITEGADLVGLPVSALRAELSFLKALPEVKNFEFEGASGVYKVYMIGSKFLVDGKYTESGDGKYRILGKSKNGNVLQEGDSGFGWKHIVEGHVDGKSGKSMFPKGMSKSKIKELILESSDGPIKRVQGDRVMFFMKFNPSKYGISEIEGWINKKGNFIETAYPKSGAGMWTFPKSN